MMLRHSSPLHQHRCQLPALPKVSAVGTQYSPHAHAVCCTLAPTVLAAAQRGARAGRSQQSRHFAASVPVAPCIERLLRCQEFFSLHARKRPCALVWRVLCCCLQSYSTSTAFGLSPAEMGVVADAPRVDRRCCHHSGAFNCDVSCQIDTEMDCEASQQAGQCPEMS